MRVEAKKTLLKPEPSRIIDTYRPIPTSTLITPSITPVVPITKAYEYTQKVGILYSDQDKECALKILEQIPATRIESPFKVYSYKYIIWVASVDGINDCADVLDTAMLFPEKLLIFWWRAAALECLLDTTMMSTREIYDSSFAFFPTSGTYIFSNAPTSFCGSLAQLMQWIKSGKNPQGQRIKSQKFY